MKHLIVATLAFILHIFATGCHSGTASVLNIDINADGADTIDGAAALTLTTNYESVKLINDGTKWMVIG